MKFAGTQRNAGWIMAAIMAATMLSGCGTPPAVEPLLRIADGALDREATLVEQDLARDLEQLTQTRKTLAAAFDQDLVETDQLSADWVRAAAEVYAAAREELVRHEAQLRQARLQRADNLRAAGEAVRRALFLLQRQDAVIDRTLGADAWQLLSSNSSPDPNQTKENP